MTNQKKALTQLTREELAVAQNFVEGWREGLISCDDVAKLQQRLQDSTAALANSMHGSEITSRRKLALITLSAEELQSAAWFISLFRDHPAEQAKFWAFLTCCHGRAPSHSITPVHLSG